MKYILGISAFYHDSAAVLLKDGIIIAAAQEERFTRKKNEVFSNIHMRSINSYVVLHVCMLMTFQIEIKRKLERQKSL